MKLAPLRDLRELPPPALRALALVAVASFVLGNAVGWMGLPVFAAAGWLVWRSVRLERSTRRAGSPTPVRVPPMPLAVPRSPFVGVNRVETPEQE